MRSNVETLLEIINQAYAEIFSCLSHVEVRNPHPRYKLGQTLLYRNLALKKISSKNHFSGHYKFNLYLYDC